MRNRTSYFSLLGLVMLMSTQLVYAQNWEWVKGFSSPNGDAEGKAVTCDQNGNIYLTGTYTGTATLGSTTLASFGNKDIFVAKLDSLGNVLWAIRAGGSGQDEVNDIETDLQGNVYLTGQFQGSANFFGSVVNAQGTYDAFTVKLNTNGFLNWVRTGGTTTAAINDFGDIGEALVVDLFGNVFVLGKVDDISNASFNGVAVPSAFNFSLSGRYLIRYSSSGTVQWVRGSEQTNDKADLALDALDQLVAVYLPDINTASSTISNTYTKYSRANTFLFSSSVTDLFSRASLGHDNANATYLGNNIFSGTSTQIGSSQYTSSGGVDGVLVKFNTAGTVVWVQQFGGSGDDWLYDIETKPNGNSLVGGAFNNVATFDTILLQSSGTKAYVAEYSGSGDVQWAIHGGSGNGDAVYDMALTPSNQAIVTGRFFSSSTFGPHQLQSSGFADVFVAKIGCKPNQTLTLVGDTAPCAKTTTYRVSNYEGNQLQWSVSAGGNVLQAAEDSAVVQWNSSGSQQIEVFASNSCGSGPSSTLSISVKPLPTAPTEIVGDSLVCQGNESYQVQAVAFATDYRWTRSSMGLVSELGTNAVVNWNQNGNDTLFVQAQNTCGLSSPAALPVTVLSQPTQPSAISGVTQSCAVTESYQAPSASAFSSYSWTLSSGGILTANANSATVQWTQAGTHNLSVVSTNICGSSPPRQVNVQVQTQPDEPVLLSGDKTVCFGLENYQVLQEAGETYNWTVSGGGALVANNNSASVIWNTTGLHQITVTPQNSCGSGKALLIDVEAKTTPAAIDSIIGEDSVCQGSQNYFVYNPSADAYTWSLNSGGVLSPQNQSASVNWISDGSFTLSVTPSNACGSGPTKSLQIAVDTATNAFTGILGQTTACLDTQVYWLPSVSGFTYNWSLSSGGILNATNDSAQVIWNQTGNHYLSVSSSAGCKNLLQVAVNDIPAAVDGLAGDSLICTGTNAFSVLARSAETYAWTSVNGASITTTPNGANAFVTHANAGIDTLIITSVNNCGVGPETKKILQINQTPLLSNLLGDSLDCKLATSQFNVNLDTTATYFWNNSGGQLVAASNSAQVYWPDTGNFQLEVYAQNSCGTSATLSKNIQVIEPAMPPDSLYGAKEVCKGFQLYSIDTVKNQSYTWVLTKGGTLATNGKDAVIQWQQPGQHTLAIIPSNACGIGSIKSVTIEVNDVPKRPNLIIGDTLPCVGNQTYVANAQDANAYFWTLPGGGTVNATNDTCRVNWNNSGIYLLQVIPSNQCGTGLPLNLNIRAQTLPAAPTISGDTAVCQGSKLYSVPFVPNQTYSWSLNGGGVLSSTATQASVNWASSGVHQISAVGTNKCGLGQAGNISVRVTLPPPKPSLTGGDTLACLGNQTYSLSQIAGASYSWLGPNTFTDTVNTVSFDWVQTGLDSLAALAFNQCGASDTLRIPIRVIDAPADTVNLSGDTLTCLNSKFYGAQSASSTTYNWGLSGGGSLAVFNDTAVVSWNTTGLFSLSVRAQNKCGMGPITSQNIRVIDIPTTPSAIVGNTTTCLNTVDSFSVNASFGTQYLWNLNGGGIITPANATAQIQWVSPGVYQLAVTPFNSCGSGNARTTLVEVNTVLAKPIWLQADSVACLGTNFYQVNPYTQANINWQINANANLVDAANNAVVNFSDTGFYSLSVSAENQCGYSDTLAIKIKAIDVPQTISAIAGDTALCPVRSVYSANSAEASAINWTLLSGGSITPMGDSVAVEWITPGNHSLIATAQNRCGAGAKDTMQVQVLALPQPLNTLLGPTIVCFDDASIFTASTGLTSEVQWDLSDGGELTSAGDTANVKWNKQGSFVLSAYPVNSCGLGAGKNVNVTVLDKPQFEGGIIGEQLVCEGDLAVYQVPTTPNTTFNWNVDSGQTLSASANQALVEWNTAGVDTIEMQATNQCGSSESITLSVAVDSVYTEPSLLFNGAFFEVSPHRYYQWYLDDTPISGANAASFVPIEEGIYSVGVISACGTEVLSNRILYQPKTIEELLFRIYPNPTTDYFTIEIPANKDWQQIQILDLKGNVVFNTRYVDANSNRIDVSALHLSSGAYIVKVNSPSGTFTEKLMVDGY